MEAVELSGLHKVLSVLSGMHKLAPENGNRFCCDAEAAVCEGVTLQKMVRKQNEHVLVKHIIVGRCDEWRGRARPCDADELD